MLPLPPSVSVASDDAAELARGKQRIRRMHWTVAAAVAGRGATILVTLITIPLTVRYLGPAQYGYWVAILSTTGLLAFADLGLGYGLLNRAAAALGVGETLGARRLVSNAFILLAGLAGAGSFSLLVGLHWLPWSRWFPGTDQAAAIECGRAVLVLAIAFLAGLPLTTWQRTVGAAQQGFWIPCFDALGSGLSLGGLLLVIGRRGGLVELAAAYAAGPLVALICGWLWFFGWSRPDLRPRRVDWDARVAGAILAEGTGYFVLQLGGLLLASVGSLILLHRCGPDELTHYSLTAKLFQFGPQLAAFWFAPLWPAYSEALARGDVRWAHHTLWRTTLACLVVGVAGCAVLVPSVAMLVRWWTGAQIEPTLSLRLALAALTVLSVATASVSTFLNASRFLRPQAWLTVAMVPATLLLAWMFAGSWGSAGVAWGMVAGYALIVVPAYFAMLPGVLARQRERPEGAR